jgi:hypothetical protein
LWSASNLPSSHPWVDNRWLEGGSNHDIQDAEHFFSSTFFHLLKKGLCAVLNCDELVIALPEKSEDLF